MGRGAGGAALTKLPVLLAEPVWVAAPRLLGCLVSAHGVTVRLTEVEAYSGVGEDPASHAHRGRTRRNAVMFGPPGYAYVYFVFGMHWCLNVVCGPPETASAVLLRAGEVVSGVDTARARARRASTVDASLARGPARLTSVLAVDGTQSGTFLLDGSGPISLALPALPVPAASVRSGPRVGVAGGHDTPWRFWLDGDPTVSAYRRHVPRARRA
ncbi:MAG TPA: DNA-3-methyladenine glycosylase [Micromonosporaceae bacterium]|nr:DNA-3-methyladenine glycosylase [Micromonosporaceae bacterium]